MSLDYSATLARSLAELRLKTNFHDQTWHLGEADWEVEQDAGRITFTAPSGVVAECDVQFIGSFNTDDSTWLWAWEHPSVSPPLDAHAQKVREYGEEHGVTDFTTRKLETTEERCWEFAAVACHLNGARGAYRGPSGPTLVFMTFGEPHLTRPDGTGGPAAAVTVPPFSAPGPLLPDDGFNLAIPDDVRERVVGFISALHDWEVGAHTLSERENSEATAVRIRRDYEEVLRVWCGPNFPRQGFSYTSPPSHDPGAEELTGWVKQGDLDIVRSRIIDERGRDTVYEYHLRRSGNRLLVQQLYFVNACEGERFECL